MAESPTPPSPADLVDSVGWISSLDGLRAIAERLRLNVPPDDAGSTADLAVKMFGSMMGAYLAHLSADPQHPTFLPAAGYYTMYGSPNPDTIYRTAVIDDQGDYLITGHRGTVPDVSVMPFGGPTASGPQTFPHFDLNEVAINDDGTFEIIVSQRPPDSNANWWRLEPGVRTLMLRSVSDDWGKHTEPRIAIIRLDVDPRRARPAPELTERRLRSYGMVVEAMVMSGVNRVRKLKEEGAVNRLVEVDYSANGGLVTQWYQEGCFDLGAGEALLLEARPAVGCETFSFSLTDEYFSTVDWANAQSSLNQRQAIINADGILRVVVAGTDPGVHNWLDTTGHERGVLQCRWLGGTEGPDVTVRKIAAGDVAEDLPADTVRTTPTERAEAIRTRQIGVQLRSLW
jgi:hypothetical protein